MKEKEGLIAGILFVFFILVLITTQAGCIGFQQSNLTFSMPANMETIIGKQDTLQIEVLPLEADAKDVVFSLYAPPEISLTDSPQAKEFKTLTKDQKVIVPFNYSATTDGTFNLTLEIKMPENSTKYNVTVNVSVPAPELEVGEFWIYNQTKGNAKGLQVEEITRKDTIEGKEYYVMKKTWEGDPVGTYALSYYSTDTFSEKMTEYYEDDSLLKEKTSEIDPPSSYFPFKTGDKGVWSGSITGLGKSEVSSEVVKKEKITVPSGTYTGYYIRTKASLSMATSTGEEWYIPELNGYAKIHVTANSLGVTNEGELELLEHGKPPAVPRKVQLDIKIPEGYKLYKNDKLNFRITYPKNWDFTSEDTVSYSSFYFKDSNIYSVSLSVESTGNLNLTDYREASMANLRKALPGVRFSEIKSVTVNGREGVEWLYEFTPYYTDNSFKGKMVMFVADGKGYIITGFGLGTSYNSYKPMFDDIVNSFFIRGSPNKYVLS